MTAKEIKELREKLGYTQAELAEAIGVRVVTVSRWENNQSKPSRLALFQLKHLEP